MTTDAEKLAEAVERVRMLCDTADRPDALAVAVAHARAFLAKIEPDPRKVLDDHLDPHTHDGEVIAAWSAITAQLDAQAKEIAELRAPYADHLRAEIAAAEKRGWIAGWKEAETVTRFDDRLAAAAGLKPWQRDGIANYLADRLAELERT